MYTYKQSSADFVCLCFHLWRTSQFSTFPPSCYFCKKSKSTKLETTNDRAVTLCLFVCVCTVHVCSCDLTKDKDKELTTCLSFCLSPVANVNVFVCPPWQFEGLGTIQVVTVRVWQHRVKFSLSHVSIHGVFLLLARRWSMTADAL